MSYLVLQLCCPWEGRQTSIPSKAQPPGFTTSMLAFDQPPGQPHVVMFALASFLARSASTQSVTGTMGKKDSKDQTASTNKPTAQGLLKPVSNKTNGPPHEWRAIG